MEKSGLSNNADAQSLQQHNIAATLARFKQDWHAVRTSLNEIQRLIEKQHANLRMITAITLRLSHIREKYSCQFFNQEQLEQSTDQKDFDLQ
jgi:hypothetical protein